MIWVVILIGCAVREICFNQWEWHVKYGISLAGIMGKPVGALQNVGCFLRLKKVVLNKNNFH